MVSTQKRSGPSLGFRFFLLSALTLFGSCLAPLTSYAQDDPDPIPPPSQVISREERERLDSRSGAKDRTKLALELLNSHLAASEQMRGSENFEGAYRELGTVHGLLDNAINYLIDANRRGYKVLDEFKRMDIGLRALLPRIESLRRDLPLIYDAYVRALLQHVRDARAKAVEPFFDDSIVTDHPAL